jgi:uncharacterized membrane protein YccC
MHVLVAWAWNLSRRRLPAPNAKSLKSAGASAASALLFGLRLSTSVCLALYIALWFQIDDPPMCLLRSLGTVQRKCLMPSSACQTH